MNISGYRVESGQAVSFFIPSLIILKDEVASPV
jgi:hypothetical protein